jgi:hypothetical protein
MIIIFWDVTPYGLVECYQCFRGTCCLQNVGKRLHSITSQKLVIFTVTAVAKMETYNLNCAFKLQKVNLYWHMQDTESTASRSNADDYLLINPSRVM